MADVSLSEKLKEIGEKLKEISLVSSKLKDISAVPGTLKEIIVVPEKLKDDQIIAGDAKREIKWIKNYSSSHKILLVGEGDFSFSSCLARAFSSATNMVASSLDSKTSLKKSECASRNLKLLKEMGCVILHSVDVHTMSQHSGLIIGKRFDRIVFNFPHAGFGASEHSKGQIKLHQKLVMGFFYSAQNMLTNRGEVHVTHKTTYPYSEWKIVNLASRAGLYLVEEEEFSLSDYPGYINKRGSGIDNIERSFHLGFCSTYKFAKESK